MKGQVLRAGVGLSCRALGSRTEPEGPGVLSPEAVLGVCRAG